MNNYPFSQFTTDTLKLNNKVQIPNSYQNVNLKTKNDSFEKKSNLNSNQVDSNSYNVGAKCNINFSAKNKKIIIATTTIALASTIALIIGHKKNVDLQKSLSEMSEKFKEQSDTNSQLQKNYGENIKNLQKEIEYLKNNKNNIIIDKNSADLINEKVSYYENIINNAKLDYDPLSPPAAKEAKKSIFITKFFPKKEVTTNVGSIEKSNYVENLIDELNTNGKIKINPAANASCEVKTFLNGEAMEDFNINKPNLAGIKLHYGENISWSNQKIARDIMQNFYDANNYTLDGVGVEITKVSDSYKIRIDGGGIYSCADLLELGSGNKMHQSPYNAGGFGEGSRIVVASLLGQNKTDKVRFASSDWEMDFIPKKDSIYRTIKHQPEVLNGNYIEFETKDKDFAESVIKSLGYFNSSKNSDFQNLTFENDCFGFRVLAPGESGNLYLSQRFEYGKSGAWDGNVENLNLIFKRKPDLKRYEELTGEKFSIGRDRNCLTSDDVEKLTKYFASDLSDEQLIDAILSTESLWKKIPNDKDTAISAFLTGLCDVASTKGIGIDFGASKICVRDSSSENIIKSIISDGYSVISRRTNLSQVGMLSVGEVSALGRIHKAVKPNSVEIKKLKCIEEAIGVIQRGLEKTYSGKIRSVVHNCDKNLLELQYRFKIAETVEKLEKAGCNDEFIQKYKNTDSFFTLEEFNKDYIKYLYSKVDSINENNLQENKPIVELILDTLRDNVYYSNADKKIIEQNIAELKNIELISKADVCKPRYIFDRHKEISNATLGEAIIEKNKYQGHWVDKDYLNNAGFHELLAIWLHEISHKSGGDGSAEFTYKLTDLIAELLEANSVCSDFNLDLVALEKVFNGIY